MILKKTKLFILIVVIAACNDIRKKEKDSFYEDSRSWDVQRIPLIKPYELISNDQQTWTIDFYNGEFGNVKWSGSIDSIGVRKEFIVLYNNLADVNNDNKPTWFILNSTTKKGEYFFKYKLYSKYLQSNKIDNLTLYPPGDAFQFLLKNSKLPWEK